jgi:sodium-dependent phosphate transporter
LLLLLLLPLLLHPVGSIIGFALAFGGTGAVQWARPDPRSFPPYRGIVPIVLSWVVSPILTGAVAAMVFGLTRCLVLRREKAAKLAFWVLPPAVLITVMINVFFVCKYPAQGWAGCGSKDSDNVERTACLTVMDRMFQHLGTAPGC